MSESVDTVAVRYRAGALAAGLPADDWLWNVVLDLQSCADEIDKLRREAMS